MLTVHFYFSSKALLPAMWLQTPVLVALPEHLQHIYNTWICELITI